MEEIPKLIANEEKELEQKKDKIVSWLKKPINFSLFTVLFIGIAFRLYYFWMTRAQPLWWDELCYGSLAKNMISHAWNGTSLIIGETNIRPMIFPFLWSLLLRLNLGELVSRILLVLLPSIASLFFVYLIGKEIYGKRVGIISAFIYGVLWINLFYTARLLVHMLDLAFLFASIYFFLRAVKPEKELDYKSFAYSLVLLSIATMTRFQDGMVFFIYLLILVLSKKLYLNKVKFWYAGIIGVSPMFIFFIINFVLYGNIFPALFGNYLTSGTDGKTTPFAFGLLNYIPVYLTPVLFVLFLIGLAIIVFEIVIGFSLINKNEKLRGGLILILILVLFFSFFIFYLKAAEDRWLFETAITMVIISAFGANFVYEFLSKYSKIAGVLILVLMLVFGGYAQYKQADPLIKTKQASYLQMKQGFEWIKANTPASSVIIGHGIEPYAIYYADRQYLKLPENDSNGINLGNADYLVAHAFVPQPAYLNGYLQDNQKNLEIINVFFFDSQQTQPAMVIYKIKKTSV